MIAQVDSLAYFGGISLALLATMFFNYAPLLMKISLGEMPEITGKTFWASIKRMLTNKRWLTGMCVSITGGVFYFLALDLAGVTIVQPLLNFGFIMLAIAANRMLGEKLDVSAKIAIGLLIIMPVFITLGNVAQPLPLSNYAGMLWFSLGCVAIIGVLFALSQKIVVLWGLTTGVSLGISALFMQWFTLLFFAGVKATGNLFTALGMAIGPGLISLFGNIVANVVFMQIGLQKSPASRFNPINGTINMITTIIGGMLLFGQVVGNWWFYSVGLMIGVIGVVLLSKYQLNTPAPAGAAGPALAPENPDETLTPE